MKVFLIIALALWSAAVFSQTPVYDTTGKSLQQQIEAMSRQADSLRVLATAKSELLNKIGQQCTNAMVLLQQAREVTIFDRKLFIDTLVHRMALIITGKSDFEFKTMQQFEAVIDAMQKAASVYTPNQKKLVDSLGLQYIALDNRRRDVQQEFDNILIALDDCIGTLEELKKKINTK